MGGLGLEGRAVPAGGSRHRQLIQTIEPCRSETMSSGPAPSRAKFAPAGVGVLMANLQE